MKNETFNLKRIWKVSFGGRVLSPEWGDKGPAEACLSLLKSGKGQVTTSGGIRWNLTGAR
jgi:hypothetical protein